MKKLIFTLFISIAVFSCSDENPSASSRNFYENTEVEFSHNPGTYLDWSQGTKTVIRFGLTHPDDKNISDDELTEFFWIEIPSNISSFDIDSFERDISPIQVYYTRSCYCFYPEAFEISNIQASGSRISSNQWRISFEMTAFGESNTYNLKDSGRYSLDVIEYGP